MLKLLLKCDKCGKEITGPYKSVKDCTTEQLIFQSDIHPKAESCKDICMDCWNLFMSLKEVPVYTGKVKE